MNNQFQGVGNLGAAPRLSTVLQDDTSTAVLDLRIYFPRRVPAQTDGEFEDRGGFWLNVSLWGGRAEHLAPRLAKGTRVFVAGTLKQDSWTDRASGEPRSALQLRAEYLALDPLGLAAGEPAADAAQAEDTADAATA